MIEFTLNGKPIAARNGQVNHDLDGSTATFDLGEPVSPADRVEVTIDGKPLMTGIVSHVKTSGGTSSVVVTDYTRHRAPVTLTYGGTASPGSAPAQEWPYGTVVRHKDCPDQREMVIWASQHVVHTVVLDRTDSHSGEVTSYIPSMLEVVE